MTFIDALQKRHSEYALEKDPSLDKEQVKALIGEVLDLTPDAFNMQSQRLILLFDQASEDFWDEVNATYDNKLDKEKLAGFKRANGTILYFIDQKTVHNLGESFPLYKDAFGVYATHANGMAQINIWNALTTLNLGASLQHYGPAIETWVKERYQVPENYQLVAQMPFGKVITPAEAKDKLPRQEKLTVFEA